MNYFSYYDKSNALKATLEFATAKRRGEIIPQPCEVCGISRGVHGHHEDYSKPLEIRWLCNRHHMMRHNEMRAMARETVLNKCAAIIQCKAGSIEEIARFTHAKADTVHDWLYARGEDHIPTGRTLYLMNDWAAAKTLGIAASGQKLQNAYRTGVKQIVAEHSPVSGKFKRP